MSITSQLNELYGNIIDADSYKLSHHSQYPPSTDNMMSYIESRGGKYDKIMMFGLQMILKEYFLDKITHKNVDNLKAFSMQHVGFFNETAWRKSS